MIIMSIVFTLALLVFFHFMSEDRMSLRQWVFAFLLFFPVCAGLLFCIQVLNDERAYQEARFIMGKDRP